jgi:large subunit ribosomal protein L29
MKIKELRKKTNEELLKLLQDKKSQVVQFKINISSGNVKNVRELRETKKDISRILTLLNESK